MRSSGIFYDLVHQQLRRLGRMENLPDFKQFGTHRNVILLAKHLLRFDQNRLNLEHYR